MLVSQWIYVFYLILNEPFASKGIQITESVVNGFELCILTGALFLTLGYYVEIINVFLVVCFLLCSAMLSMSCLRHLPTVIKEVTDDNNRKRREVQVKEVVSYARKSIVTLTNGKRARVPCNV